MSDQKLLRAPQTQDRERNPVSSPSLSSLVAYNDLQKTQSAACLRTKLSQLSSSRQPHRSESGLLKKNKTIGLFVTKKSQKKLATTASLNPLQDFANLKRLETIVRDGTPDAFNAPSFRLMPFGDAWYADVLTIHTNALRYETKTLFFILYCLYERADTLEVGDIKSFYGWFEHYHNFFVAEVALLQETFLPWVERSADLPSSRPREYFEKSADALQRTAKKTLEHKEDFVGFSPGKAARKLRAIYSKFAVHLLDYLSGLEDSSAMIIECHYTIEEGIEASQKMVSALSQKPHYKKNIVLLLRWLADRQETAAQWRKQHLDVKTNMSYGRWKRPSSQEECLSYFRKKCKAVVEESIITG